jgi:hypothetical protein
VQIGAEMLKDRRRIANVTAVAVAAMSVGVLLCSPASADPPPRLKSAVEQLRGAGQCGPMQYDPIAEHTAEIVNRSTFDYLSQQARHVPVTDALPIFRDLGGTGGNAHILLGAGDNDGDAIKGLILQGHAAIPDCSYTGFGASLLWNEPAAKALTTVILVGP